MRAQAKWRTPRWQDGSLGDVPAVLRLGKTNATHVDSHAASRTMRRWRGRSSRAPVASAGGRGPSSHGTNSAWAASSPAIGTPAPARAAKTVIRNRGSAGGRNTPSRTTGPTVRRVSSKSSRRAFASGSSPGSARPAGKLHRPFDGSRERSTSSTASRRSTIMLAPADRCRRGCANSLPTSITASMCGRYTLIANAEAIRLLFELPAFDERLVVPRYNIAPTQPIVVVRNGARGRELLPMRWGLIPAWAKDPTMLPLMINARAEGTPGESRLSLGVQIPAMPGSCLGLLRMADTRGKRTEAALPRQPPDERNDRISSSPLPASGRRGTGLTAARSTRLRS